MYRAETTLKDLVDLVQHPQALHQLFRQTDEYVFRFLATCSPQPAPGRVLQVAFAPSPASAGGARVQEAVEGVFARNQGKLGYCLWEPGSAIGPAHVIQVTLVPAASSGWNVTWKLPRTSAPSTKATPFPPPLS